MSGVPARRSRGRARPSWIVVCAGLLVSLLVAAVPKPAAAHEMSMAELELQQLPSGDFLWQWTAGATVGDSLLQPMWPPNCRDEDGTLRCGEDGMRGTVGVQGVGTRVSAVILKVRWREGVTRVYTLTQAQPEVQLFGAADDARGAGAIAAAYGVLGIEHILTGYDHLLFVIGLLFLVGFNRRLVWTITAFTAAHSVTLALSVLGWITLRQAPVEATIALSILLVAGEAMHGRPTLSRRWPALVAFLFGLAHGLGFAGALKQFGLPDNHLAMALFSFNVGVELGQLGVVALAFGAAHLLQRTPIAGRGRTPALYAIGSVAAYWSWLRVVALFG